MLLPLMRVIHGVHIMYPISSHFINLFLGVMCFMRVTHVLPFMRLTHLHYVNFVLSDLRVVQVIRSL